MGAKFEFRGNLLYRFANADPESNAGVVEILLPLCKPKKGDLHKDKSPKREHFAGIMIAKDVDPVSATYIDLTNAVSVEIGLGEPVAEFKADAKRGLPWLGDVKNVDYGAVACRVLVLGTGDWLRKCKDKENVFEYKNAERPLSLSYEFAPKTGDTPILVRYANGVQPFIVHRDERAFVYSSDVENPSRATLYREEAVEKGKEKKDIDFNWLYETYEHGKKNDGTYPIPTANPGRTVNVSTCFSGGGG